MKSNIVFSSSKDDWRTPIELFRKLDLIYRFQLDAAADAENTLVQGSYYTKEKSGLEHPWVSVTWCNPPYSLNKQFVAKAALEWAISDVRSVLLLPARTDTKWFHEYVYQRLGVRFEFLRGRLKFSGSKNSAPFPSMLVYFGV